MHELTSITLSPARNHNDETRSTPIQHVMRSCIDTAFPQLKALHLLGQLAGLRSLHYL